MERVIHWYSNLTASEINFDFRLQGLESSAFLDSLTKIKRGVEREALRICPDGSLAQTPHAPALGSALTHESITTDFSESLLEFITPPESDTEKTMHQLADIHKFVGESIDEEMLWPLSMPCFITDENHIPIADYGESNIGKMKRVYRVGLKNRYGSMMQAIAGIHFNFSFSEEFWQQWFAMHGQAHNQDNVSAAYFGLIRNYRRLCWLIPYLYGASPALCGSFLKGKEHNLPFKKVGKGTYYLPYATSLRMSDLGYTNAEQSALRICYNELDNYVSLLRSAMDTPATAYAKFAAGEEGHFQQLSKNVLQIENELYSPIRPKQPAQSMEKPTDALIRRGVSYIEVRALDVNPFSPIGIRRDQFDFLDVFLLTCLLLPSDELNEQSFEESEYNLNTVVLEGRREDLVLRRNGEDITRVAWSQELFGQFAKVAAILDKAYGTKRYSTVVANELEKVANPALTLSGQWLNQLLAEDMDNGQLGLSYAKQYVDKMASFDYAHTDAQGFTQQSAESLSKQKEIEAADTQDFGDFIREYFDEAPAKKMPG